MIAEPKTYRLMPDGPYPNNPRLPLVFYPQAVALTDKDPAAVFEARFHTHGWGGSWRNGVFTFHHYHSTAHEVLGIYRGEARVRFGGSEGIDVGVQTGDVVIIPAGVAHQKLSSSSDFAVVGAYPRGQSPDLCRGQADERYWAENNIQAVPLPEMDPLCGPSGGLMALWHAQYP